MFVAELFEKNILIYVFSNKTLPFLKALCALTKALKSLILLSVKYNVKSHYLP